MDDTQEASHDVTPIPAVGAALRAMRQAQGLTVANVAERTKFSVKQVEALEQDNLSALPQGTFLRGFVRSYARVLRVDEAPLLAMMSTTSESQGGAHSAIHPELSLVQKADKRFFFLMVAAAFVALLTGLLMLSQHEVAVEQVVVQDVKLPELASASAVLPITSGVVAASSVALAESKPSATPPNPPLKEVAVKPVAVAPQTQVVLKPQVTVPVAVKKDATVAKPEIAPDHLKKRPIHIVFEQDSWMEIVDANGELLLSRMNAAGSEKWIGGMRRAPYQVSIGQVGAVKIYYRGREVDLSKHAKTGVVHLVLE